MSRSRLVLSAAPSPLSCPFRLGAVVQEIVLFWSLVLDMRMLLAISGSSLPQKCALCALSASLRNSRSRDRRARRLRQ